MHANTISHQEQLQNEVHERIKHFSANYKGVTRANCKELVLDLLGGDAHMAVDQIYEMKHVFTDLLVFLCDPEISMKFKKVRRNVYSDHYADHLRRVLLFLDRANNPLTYAEIADQQLEDACVDEKTLNNLMSDYCNKPY